MDHRLRLTVVIPCRNDADMLDHALAALAAQTRPADRIIVVDNGSSDDSAAVARRYGATVVSEPSVGIWPAASRGYDEALEHADLIARIDADSRPHPDWIARLHHAFEADPTLGVLTGGAEFYGGNRLQNHLAERWYIGGGQYWIKKFVGIPLVFGSNFAMRARVWRKMRERVDRMNPGIHDDLDLTIRLRAADGVRYDPELRMPVSARPVLTVSGLTNRVAMVLTTFAASWPEGAPWRREDLRTPVRDAVPVDVEWLADGEDWAPEFGR